MRPTDASLAARGDACGVPAELCEVDPWTQMCGQRGCTSPVTPFNPMPRESLPSTSVPADLEALVQKITDEIVANLK